MINQTDWWQLYLPPLVGLLGSIIVAAAAFTGVIKNNRTNQRAIDAADDRHKEQLQAARAEGVADRAAQRVDKFREDVASILAERWPTLDAAVEMADAVDQYHRDRENPEVTPHERVTKFNAARLERREPLNRLIQLTIRASLLTNDPDLLAALKGIREVSSEGWNAIKWTLNSQGDPYDEEKVFREKLHAKLGELESLTRKLVTSDDATNSSAAQTD
jgi:hypothetical protein